MELNELSSNEKCHEWSSFKTVPIRCERPQSNTLLITKLYNYGKELNRHSDASSCGIWCIVIDLNWFLIAIYFFSTISLMKWSVRELKKCDALDKSDDFIEAVGTESTTAVSFIHFTFLRLCLPSLRNIFSRKNEWRKCMKTWNFYRRGKQ